jgi:hypothetical protein
VGITREQQRQRQESGRAIVARSFYRGDVISQYLATRRDKRASRRWPLRAALGHVMLALVAAPVAAEPAPDQVRALDAKIGDTPAQSINLRAAGRVAAGERMPLPAHVPGAVVPGASKFKDDEARFIALFPSDEQSLVDFVRAQRELPDEAQLLRGVFRTLATGEQVVTLKALAFARGPLHFNARRDRFEGRVGVGLVAITEGAPVKLATPVPFRVLGQVSSTPARFLVDHVGPPYGEIEVATPALSSTLDVQVVSAATPDGVTLSLSALPALRMVTRPARIQGLGLASADLTFEVVGPRKGANEVRLSASLGQLSGTSFRLLAGHARATLRSQRVGTAAVTLTAPGLEPAKLDVEFAFPWELLVAALLGGLVGTLAQRGFEIGRNEALTAVLLGGLTAILYVWSMEQLPLELPAPVGEILVSLLATMATYYGTKLYMRIASSRARAT